MNKMKAQTVTDMRTGIVHPKRDTKGRFISNKRSAKMVRFLDQIWMAGNVADNVAIAASFLRRS